MAEGVTEIVVLAPVTVRIYMIDKKLEISAKKYRGETAIVTSRLAVELIEKIDDVVKKTGRSRSEIIQLCIEFAIENVEIIDE